MSNERPSKSSAGGQATWPSLRVGAVALAILVLAVLAAGLAIGRARIVAELADVPRPGDLLATAPSPLGGESAGARTLSSARRLAGSGDISGALRLLGTISREDPAFPAAESLRSEMRGTTGDRR